MQSSEVSRNQANDEFARLRQIEQEHRDRMRNHLREVLADGRGDSPRRLTGVSGCQRQALT